MNQRRLLIAASIIAVIVVGSFALSVPHTRDVLVPRAAENTATVIPAVSLHDAFKKGTHTISGSLIARDACSIISVSPSRAGDASSTEYILLTITQPEDSGVCLQVPTKMNFSTSIAAPAQLPITVTVNGHTASTTSL